MLSIIFSRYVDLIKVHLHSLLLGLFTLVLGDN